MNLQTILNQFTGSANSDDANKQGVGGKLGNLIPGGLAGGAMAGGVMALLLGNKSARKFAGTAATYGGAALLGGLAYKAYQNWQHDKHNQMPISEKSFTSAEILSPDFQLTLIKAMIAAARADGHIDAAEQQHIFDAIDKMELSTEMKAVVFDLLRQPISVNELAQGATSLEQKSEIYLASFLIVDHEHPAAKAHLAQLDRGLDLPAGLALQLQTQAQQAMADT
jgi:uncharacterized membrane protein YebE (DUF533 family)